MSLQFKTKVILKTDKIKINVSLWYYNQVAQVCKDYD